MKRDVAYYRQRRKGGIHVCRHVMFVALGFRLSSNVFTDISPVANTTDFNSLSQKKQYFQYLEGQFPIPFNRKVERTLQKAAIPKS
jgi:hypothetical protein